MYLYLNIRNSGSITSSTFLSRSYRFWCVIIHSVHILCLPYLRIAVCITKGYSKLSKYLFYAFYFWVSLNTSIHNDIFQGSMKRHENYKVHTGYPTVKNSLLIASFCFTTKQVYLLSLFWYKGNGYIFEGNKGQGFHCGLKLNVWLEVSLTGRCSSSWRFV